MNWTKYIILLAISLFGQGAFAGYCALVWSTQGPTTSYSVGNPNDPCTQGANDLQSCIEKVVPGPVGTGTYSIYQPGGQASTTAQLKSTQGVHCTWLEEQPGNQNANTYPAGSSLESISVTVPKP